MFRKITFVEFNQNTIKTNILRTFKSVAALSVIHAFQFKTCDILWFSGITITNL